MNKVKKIILVVIATICCVALLVGGILCSRRVDVSPCTKVHIVILDSLYRKNVSIQELEEYLIVNERYGLGQPMDQIDCYAIEQLLLQHDMIRTADCYKTAYGALCINLTQRVPIYAFKVGEQVRLVDSDRRIMPCRTGMDTNLILLTGVINEQTIRNEYFDFVSWLLEDPYWNVRMQNIHVQDPKNIVLTEKGQSYRILLGSLDGYTNKLKRLHDLYAKAFEQIGYPECKELDLRFNGQVVER